MIRLACALVASRARFVVPSYRGTGARKLDFTSTICTADFILSKLPHCLHHTLSQHFEQRCNAGIPDIYALCWYAVIRWAISPQILLECIVTNPPPWAESGRYLDTAHTRYCSPLLTKCLSKHQTALKRFQRRASALLLHLLETCTGWFFGWSCPKSSKCWRWQSPYKKSESFS